MNDKKPSWNKIILEESIRCYTCKFLSKEDPNIHENYRWNQCINNETTNVCNIEDPKKFCCMYWRKK